VTRIDALLAEFSHETTTTRKHLERLPAERFVWRPHAKSFTAGQLASHIVDCIRWVDRIFTAAEFNVDPRTFEEFDADSPAALLAGFDDETARATEAMAAASDTMAEHSWRLKINGKVRFEKPREMVFRDMTLSHLVHHRGQFSVYLRLLDVPVPGSYGPTADNHR
jgi:uncharacterized damage-inducible protein DinB